MNPRCEGHTVQTTGREFSQSCRKSRRRGIGDIDKGRRISQVQGLFGHGLGDLLSPIARIDAPHSADTVEIALAIGISHVTALAFDKNQRPFLLETVKMCVRVQKMIVILLPYFFCVETLADLLEQFGYPA